MWPKGRCVTFKAASLRSRPICGWRVQELRRAWWAHGGFIDLHFSSYSTWQPMHAARMRIRHNTRGALSILLYIASHHASLSIPDHQLHVLLLIVSNLLLAFTCNRNKLWAPSALNPFFEQWRSPPC